MNKYQKAKIGNGQMNLPMARGRYFTVYGGPYKTKPDAIHGHAAFGVKMAAEIDRPHDVNCPVHDFQVPTGQDMDRALLATVKHIATGKPVYIGCMGGIGRTGLMLAILAKAFQVEDPVAYVRANYIPHAVETKQQKDWVASYSVPSEVQGMVSWLKFKSFFRWTAAQTVSER